MRSIGQCPDQHIKNWISLAAIFVNPFIGIGDQYVDVENRNGIYAHIEIVVTFSVVKTTSGLVITWQGVGVKRPFRHNLPIITPDLPIPTRSLNSSNKP